MLLAFSDIFDTKSSTQCTMISKKIKKDKVHRPSEPNRAVLGDITNHTRKLNFEKDVLKRIKDNLTIPKLANHKYFLEDTQNYVTANLPKTKNYVSPRKLICNRP